MSRSSRTPKRLRRYAWRSDVGYAAPRPRCSTPMAGRRSFLRSEAASATQISSCAPGFFTCDIGVSLLSSAPLNAAVSGAFASFRARAARLRRAEGDTKTPEAEDPGAGRVPERRDDGGECAG